MLLEAVRSSDTRIKMLNHSTTDIQVFPWRHRVFREKRYKVLQPQGGGVCMFFSRNVGFCPPKSSALTCRGLI